MRCGHTGCRCSFPTPPHGRPLVTHTASPSDASLTVLYVEDHPVNVMLMEALLSRRPRLRLVVATTGECGWRAAVEHRPDLLLLDLRLPDCHGTELLQRLRGVPGLENVPAVAVTAEDGDLAGFGFDEIWRKPMDLCAALARLDRLLERPHPVASAPATMAAAPGWPWTAGRGRLPDPIPFPAGLEPRGKFDPM
jgi:CheY-like chemotaxis protein